MPVVVVGVGILDFGDDPVDEGSEQCDLVAEVGVDGHGCHLEPVGQLSHGEPIEAHFVEDLQGGVEDVFSRSDSSPGWVTRLAYGRFPMEPITFVMSRKMLLEIKRLAEMGR